VFLTINGVRHYLWRAVDQNGHILDILIRRRRDEAAAKREFMPSVEHRQHRYLNNRAESSHQPTRERERRMRRSRSQGTPSIFSRPMGP
jgi:putative transposase